MAQDRPIVVGVDGSESALAAVRWAARDAAKEGAALRLVASYAATTLVYSQGLLPPPGVLQGIREECARFLARASEVAASTAPEVETVEEVYEGRASSTLIELSKSARMVALGSRGLGGAAGLLLGSVSAAVASHAHCPVAILRPDSPGVPDGPVVVGADGSPVSEAALGEAFRQASVRGAKLVAVHCWADLAADTLYGFGMDAEDWQAIEENESVLLAERLAGRREEYPDVVVERVLAQDGPARQLLERSAGAQLLVVGSRGRGGFKGMLLGSTSQTLVHKAACPLLVVRPPRSR